MVILCCENTYVYLLAPRDWWDSPQSGSRGSGSTYRDTGPGIGLWLSRGQPSRTRSPLFPASSVRWALLAHFSEHGLSRFLPAVLCRCIIVWSWRLAIKLPGSRQVQLSATPKRKQTIASAVKNPSRSSPLYTPYASARTGGGLVAGS